MFVKQQQYAWKQEYLPHNIFGFIIMIVPTFELCNYSELLKRQLQNTNSNNTILIFPFYLCSYKKTNISWKLLQQINFKQKIWYYNSSSGLMLYSSDLSIERQIQIEHSSEIKVFKTHQTIINTDIDDFYASRDHLRLFSNQIGTMRYSGIRRDVVDHCDKAKINLNQNLTYQKIQKMVKNRIEKYLNNQLRMIKNKRIKKNWSEEDVLILIWIISKYADNKNLTSVQRQILGDDWNYIASLIPGVKGQNCMFKWLSLKKNNLADNRWSQRESSLLEKVVKKFGQDDWAFISQQLYYVNTTTNRIYRCPKQCREHWNCYLNPKLKKGPWSKEEDQLLLKSVKRNNGQKKWAEMVKLFNGRTQNALKNRFTLILQKQAKAHPNGKSMTQIQLIEEYLQRTFVEQFMSIKMDEDERDKLIQQNRQSEKQKERQLFKGDIRKSLRRRHSTRTLAPRTFLSIPEDKNEERSQYFPDNYYPSQFSIPQIQQHSEPIHHLNSLDDDLIWQEKQIIPLRPRDQKKHYHEKREEQLPKVEEIQVMAFNPQIFNNLRLNHFVPCTLVQNKLTKLNS